MGLVVSMEKDQAETRYYWSTWVPSPGPFSATRPAKGGQLLAQICRLAQYHSEGRSKF
jgi:hypothetical protein